MGLYSERRKKTLVFVDYRSLSHQRRRLLRSYAAKYGVLAESYPRIAWGSGRQLTKKHSMVLPLELRFELRYTPQYASRISGITIGDASSARFLRNLFELFVKLVPVSSGHLQCFPLPATLAIAEHLRKYPAVPISPHEPTMGGTRINSADAFILCSSRHSNLIVTSSLR